MSNGLLLCVFWFGFDDLWIDKSSNVQKNTLFATKPNQDIEHYLGVGTTGL